VNAAWGSNWVGEFSQEQRLHLLRRQWQLWDAAGIPVTREAGDVLASDPWGTQVRLVVAPAPTGAEPAATLAESR
jgi:hydroxymethylglutaryl-CoA lyase